MGISPSTDYASDTDSESYKKAKRSASISNFFGLFSAAKKYDYLDSTDSEITLEATQRRSKRSRNKINRNAQEPPKQTDDKINSVQRDSSKHNTTKENSAPKNVAAPVPENVPKESDKVEKALDDRSKQETRKPVKGGQATLAKDIDEVMQNYRRYSREPPEKESHHDDHCTVQHNMKSCCRGCNKDKPLYVNNSGCLGNKFSRYTCKSGELCFNNNNNNNNNNNSRHVSDPYVARNKAQPCNQKPLVSKSAPLNLRQDPARVSSQQRSPKIPLPPPPPVKLSQRDKKKPPNTVAHRQQMHNQYGFYNKPQQQQQQQQHYRPYPYEEPADSSSYSCCSRNCNGYEQCPQHRSCKCRCKCEYDNYYRQYISDDQASCGSESTKTDFMNLAYQRTGDYPELVDELENTLSQRNRLRVQKTMQQFEMLSRQNKNLDKPIFDDDESTRRHHHRSKRDSHCTSDDCRCSCCKTSTPSDRHKSGTETYKSRSESLSKRSSFQPASMPKPSGYVEKVARCMDPNYDKLSKFGKSLQQRKNNNNTIWQMDARKGEWVKVSRPNQYDFENNYPPLPPRPRSGQPYSHPEKPERQPAHHEYPDACGCNKCSRRR